MTQAEKKKARKKTAYKIYLFLAAIFLVGAVIGSLVGGTIAAATHKNTETAKSEPYGTRDGKTITDDGILIIESAEFTPLDCALSEDIQEYTYYMCQAYYLDFNFVMALMYTESSFRADIVSSSNDYGLMQINSKNHKELKEKLGITDFTDPYQNIKAGLYLLRGLFERYDDAARVCMAYNMGEYGASTLWEKGVYETTYSNKVLAKADEYAAQSLANVNE